MLSNAKRMVATAGAVTLVLVVVFVIVFSNRSRDLRNEKTQPEPPGSSGKYTESPILRDRVERGELPPVEERLPNNPLVVTPIESVGRYSSEPE